MSILLAWLPAFFSTLVAFLRSPERAFLSVFIPVLLLLPQIFYSGTIGFPSLNFSETCIIPIFIAFLFFRASHWKFCLMDGLIIAFIACSFYSDLRTSDFGFARNKLATMLCDILAPYALAKQLIHPLHLSEKLAKRIVFLMFLNVLFSFWEMRFASVPQISLLWPFFPDTLVRWPLLFRYGFVRIHGPFVQTILFGIGLTFAILLNYWLIKTKKWTPNFKYLPSLPMRKGTILMIFLCFGLLMTFSRGPWISCLFGFLLIGAGFSPRPLRSLLFRCALILLSAFLLYLIFSPSIEINPFLARSETEATVAYRGEMYRRYIELAFQSPVWGWGTLEQPFLGGFASIDNEYLLLLLQKGCIGLGLYIVMIGWSFIRLMRRGIRTTSTDLNENTLSFTLMSLLFAMTLSFATVYMGMQTEVLFFLLLGWAEGLIQSRKSDLQVNISSDLKEKKA